MMLTFLYSIIFYNIHIYIVDVNLAAEEDGLLNWLVIVCLVFYYSSQMRLAEAYYVK